MYEQRSDNTDI